MSTSHEVAVITTALKLVSQTARDRKTIARSGASHLKNVTKNEEPKSFA